MKIFKVILFIVGTILCINTSYAKDLTSIMQDLDSEGSPLLRIWLYWNEYDNMDKPEYYPENMVNINRIDSVSYPQLIIAKIRHKYTEFLDKNCYIAECQGEYIIIQENKSLDSKCLDTLSRQIELKTLEIDKEYLLAVSPMTFSDSDLEKYCMYRVLAIKDDTIARRRIKKRFFTAINFFNNTIYPVGEYIYDFKE